MSLIDRQIDIVNEKLSLNKIELPISVGNDFIEKTLLDWV